MSKVKGNDSKTREDNSSKTSEWKFTQFWSQRPACVSHLMQMSVTNDKASRWKVVFHHSPATGTPRDSHHIAPGVAWLGLVGSVGW